MMSACKSIVHKSAVHKFHLLSSCYLSQASVASPKILTSQIGTGFCNRCGGSTAEKTTVSPNTRVVSHFLFPQRNCMLFMTAISEHDSDLQTRCSFPGGIIALNHKFSVSRNFSTTSRTLSVSPPVEAAVAIASSTSTSREIIFGDFFPIYGTEKAIVYFHQITGLPWWLTIILTAFMMRVVFMIPFTVHSFRNIAKLQKLQPEVKEKADRLRLEVSMAMHQFGWDQKRAKREYNKNFKRILNELYIRENCHPLKGISTFWLQTTVWISVSYALRNMSTRALKPEIEGHDGCKDLSEQGLAWFPDLTAADSTWLLPVLMGTVTLLNIEMNYLNMPEVTKYRKWMTYGLRCCSLIFIPICSVMPSSMVLYWVSSGTFSAIQSFLFEYSPFRRLLGLPKSQSESHSPLHALRLKAKAKYWNR